MQRPLVGWRCGGGAGGACASVPGLSPEEHEAQGDDLLPGEGGDAQELLLLSGGQHRLAAVGGGGLHLDHPRRQLRQTLDPGGLGSLRGAGAVGASVRAWRRGGPGRETRW